MTLADRLGDELRAADAQIHDLVTEVEILRAILAKLKEMGVELVAYGPGRPDKAGEFFLGLDYFTVDLTEAEADLFREIVSPEARP